MKLITAIINKKDADNVSSILREQGFRFTKIATYGGFLSAKNVTLLIGVDDEQVEKALEVIRSHCRERMEPSPVVSDNPYLLYSPSCVDIPVGGATIFITNVEYYERV